MHIRKLLLLALALAFSIGNAAAQVSTQKRAEIERLLEITGALAIGQQMSNYMVTQLVQVIRKENPNVPQRVVDAIPEEVAAAVNESLPRFKEMIIPVYDKYFTLEDVRGMNAFYSTPLGRKTISVMPALMQESMTLGTQWAQTIEPRLNERLRARFKGENLKW